MGLLFLAKHAVLLASNEVHGESYRPARSQVSNNMKWYIGAEISSLIVMFSLALSNMIKDGTKLDSLERKEDVLPNTRRIIPLG